MKKVNMLIAASVILIFIGMTIQLDQLIKDNIRQQEIINSVKCK